MQTSAETFPHVASTYRVEFVSLVSVIITAVSFVMP
jgi:hypothetical protein